MDTWEYKTLVIPGDTTGTWATGVSWGVEFWFSCGGTVTQTGNLWAAGNFQAATGNVALYALASGGNFRITGVQVEDGPVATPFEQRPIGMELSLCQRYFQIINSIRIAGYAIAAAEIAAPIGYMAAMRTNPTATVGTFTLVNVATATVYAQNMGTNGGAVRIIASATGGLSAIDGQFTLSAEL